MLGQMGCQVKAINGHLGHNLRLQKGSVIWWTLLSHLVPFKLFGVCTLSLSQLSQHVTRECSPACGWHAPVSQLARDLQLRQTTVGALLFKSNKSLSNPSFYPLLFEGYWTAWWELGITAWIWGVPEEQWQISREESLHCLDLIQGGGRRSSSCTCSSQGGPSLQWT